MNDQEHHIEDPAIEDTASDGPARPDRADLRGAASAIWDGKAAFWDERVGEGTPFQRLRVGPACERLLQMQPGQVVLEVGCGNGVVSRRLADLGAHVVATDVSAAFLALARARPSAHAERIDYRLVDATDERQLLALGEGRFDAAVANMVLMDLAAIGPLLRALARLLTPAGRFVFSVLHPAFNIPGATTLVAEQGFRDGRLVETYGTKVSNYLRVPPLKGVGMPDDPLPHYYFHRSLGALFGACFAAGFVVDGLEEPAVAPQDTPGRPLGWSSVPDIPSVLVARARRAPRPV